MKMNRTLIAIDGGAAGGIAWHHPGLTPECIKMPSHVPDIISTLRRVIYDARRYSPGVQPIAYLEDIVKHMGAGIPASTMAVYAGNWGCLRGALLYSGVVLELVRPQQWQKALGLGITGRQKVMKVPGMSPAQLAAEKKRVQLLNGQLKRDWKNKLKDTALQLYPGLAEEINLGTADALLILKYGSQINGTPQ